MIFQQTILVAIRMFLRLQTARVPGRIPAKDKREKDGGKCLGTNDYDHCMFSLHRFQLRVRGKLGLDCVGGLRQHSLGLDWISPVESVTRSGTVESASCVAVGLGLTGGLRQ